MKKFIIIGGILAGVVVCVLLTYDEVLAPPPPRPPVYVKIKILIDDGKIDEIISYDQDDNVVSGADMPVGATEMDGFHTRGLKYVTEVLHATTNPETCIFINMGGWYVKICR